MWTSRTFCQLLVCDLQRLARRAETTYRFRTPDYAFAWLRTDLVQPLESRVIFPTPSENNVTLKNKLVNTNHNSTPYDEYEHAFPYILNPCFKNRHSFHGQSFALPYWPGVTVDVCLGFQQPIY